MVPIVKIAMMLNSNNRFSFKLGSPRKLNQSNSIHEKREGDSDELSSSDDENE